jgi:hypothetical protein
MKSKSKIAENASKSQGKSKYTELHMIIPVEDMKWALNQSPTIYKLFGECWASDPFGSRFMLLSTTLRGDNLRKAKKVIKDAGLFEFKVEMHVVAGERYYETFVINYHGSRSSYWKLKNQIDNPDQIDNPGQIDRRDTRTDKRDTRTDKRDTRTDNPGVPPETLTEQGSQKASVSSHKRLRNSSKEFLRREESSELTENEGENNPGRESQLSEIESSITPGGVIKNPTSSTQTLIQEDSQKASVSSHKLINETENSLTNETTVSFPNTQDGLLSKEELLRHLKWAEQGTKPTEAVIAQIREDGRYWPAFVQYARLHEWDMRNKESSTSHVKEIIEQVKAKLKKV